MSQDIFYSLPLFEGMAQTQLDRLEPLFMPCDFGAETMLFDQGDLAEFLYFIVEGEVVVVFKPDDGPPITVARVQPGGVVGWSAALGSKTYTSRALCATCTQLLRVRGSDLRRLCEEDSETGHILLDRLATVIAQRLSSTHEQVVALLKLGLQSSVNNIGG